MFRSFAFLFLCILVAVIGLEPWLPEVLKAGLVALSFSIKTGLMALLPFLIFGLMFKVAVDLYHQASRILLGLVVLVMCSNFMATWMSHYVGIGISYLQLSLVFPNPQQIIHPLWSLELPTLICNEHALLAGILVGLLLAAIRPLWAANMAGFCEKTTTLMLKMLSIVMPFFIVGFIIKMQAEGTLKQIVTDYALIFLIIGLAQYVYILGLYFLVTRHWQLFRDAVRNMLPAAIGGFSTMSSAAVMPLTLIGTARNVKNPDLARVMIPATVNNHLIGDCFAIPILAFAILSSFGAPLPSAMDYFIFTVYFVMAKFTVAAVPGGGILVMLPVLEKCLGFDPMMLSLITALYILFDPIITSANVMGNGALAMSFDKLASLVTKEKLA